MAGFFLRMLFAIPEMCKQWVRPTDQAPAAIWSRVTSGIISLCALTHKTSKVFPYYLSKPKATYIDDLKWLFSCVFNGNLLAEWWQIVLSEAIQSKRLLHMVRTAMHKFIYRRRPPLPCASRWTSMARSTDFFLLSSATNTLSIMTK